MSEVLSATNLKFLAQGMWTTLSTCLSSSLCCLPCSELFWRLCVTERILSLRWIASIYVEFVRNVPNLLWIFIIPPGLPTQVNCGRDYLFHGLYLCCLSRNHSWGLNSHDHGQTEAGLSQGFNNKQIFIYIILPPSYS